MQVIHTSPEREDPESSERPWRRILAPSGADGRAAHALAATLLLPLVAVYAYILTSRGVVSVAVGLYVAWLDFVVFYGRFVVTAKAAASASAHQAGPPGHSRRHAATAASIVRSNTPRPG